MRGEELLIREYKSLKANKQRNLPLLHQVSKPNL
jgi:hypothetical protein